jgi:hypothetical protein
LGNIEISLSGIYLREGEKEQALAAIQRALALNEAAAGHIRGFRAPT